MFKKVSLIFLFILQAIAFTDTLDLPDNLFNVKPRDSLKTPSSTVVIPIDGDIDPGLASFVKRAVEDAKQKKPEYILFKINTFGGRLDAAFDIVDIITGIKDIKTIAYVHKKAISAGALIALASNQIVMEEGTTIGDCAPIIQGGEKGIIMAGEKIESPLRAKFRNLAEKNNYPILLAQAMVSIDMQILSAKLGDSTVFLSQKQWDDLNDKSKKSYKDKKTVVAKGQLLTMTDTEAKNWLFSQGSYPSIENYLEKQNLEVKETMESSWSEELVRVIGKFAPILMLIGFGALYMEFKTPGFGLFGFIGIAALSIVFGSKYAAGLANHTELLLLTAGILCILMEMFVLPGMLIFGGLGVLLIGAGLVLSLQSFTLPDPNLPWEAEIFKDNLTYVMVTAVLALIIPILSAKFLLPRLSGSMKIITDETLGDAHVPSVTQGHPEIIPGIKGTAKTDLRPFGKIQLDSGSYEAQSLSGFIEKNSEVEIVSVVKTKITVRKIS